MWPFFDQKCIIAYMPEYLPPALEYIPKIYLEKREADLTCNQGCNLGGTLSANEAISLAIEHELKNKDHNVKVVEVGCFMR